MNPSRLEVMRHIEPEVAKAIPALLKSEEEYWQPADFLPDMGAADAFEKVTDLQAKARELSDDVMVVLIGDMITEEALPSYSAWIAQLDGFDKTGEPRTSWGEWARKWASEENRHGDVLNRYLYLTGRVNMREVEVTVQNLIADGGDVGTACDPYKAFAYTSFQEIATQVSHKNVALRAKAAGDEILARLCSFVAGDEHRHGKAYKLFYQKALDVDTNEALVAFYDMMRSKITMPAMYMREKGKKMGETFKKFADVAERVEVYTKFDYVDILENLLTSWNVSNLKGLSAEAGKAQDYLCSLPARYRKVAERFAGTMSTEQHSFSWLNVATTDPEFSVAPA
jgi:acyl-[acyl-carrier-protein] desaturase